MFNIEEIITYAAILDLEAHKISPSRIDIHLTDAYILIFENQPEINDTIIRFEDGWHSHGDIMAQILGVPIQDVPAEILDCLKTGEALLVTHWYSDGTCEKSLDFKSLISGSEIQDLGPGERIEYMRVV